MWLLSLVFDIMIGNRISEEYSKGTRTIWLAGLISLLIGLVPLLAVTIWHALNMSKPDNQVPEGAAPPFLMTLMIGGAHISLICTVINLIQAGTTVTGGYYPMLNSTHPAVAGTEDWTDTLQAYKTELVLALVYKVFVVQFLRNNQEWAGPAEAYKAN
jgi:hypothetical protein